MNDRPELWLHEEVLLLALKDEKGTPNSGMYSIGMGGAMLAELLLSERLILEEKPRKKPLKPGKKPSYLVAIDNPKSMADPVLDECLHRISTSKKPRSPQDWVTRFGQLKDLKRRVAVGLCRKGILREREDRILVLFRRTAYPTLDEAPERRIVDRVREAVAGDSMELDARTAVLVALANGTGILKPVLGKDLVKQRKDRIKEIGEGDIVGEATRAAVEAAQAAVIAATTAATVAATSAASG
ncbi:MAG: GPP34 family phosphoprotein [Gemmatimonadetes bacterium]|nr:GPP34 family phosphoprotein [Gemmatimonadota bacterium]